VGEDVVGIEFGEALGDFDRFVEAVQILQSAAQAVESVGEGGIGRKRLAVFNRPPVRRCLPLIAECAMSGEPAFVWGARL
jgi:hypothetical protein